MKEEMNIKEQINEYIKENVLLGDGDIPDENVSFTESGILDSTGFFGLIFFAESTFQIEISDDELDPENLETLSKITSFIERKLAEKDAVPYESVNCRSVRRRSFYTWFPFR